ncbi:MAG: ATP-dependent helicase [Candidatus Saccharibacteria bacterium]|nr:ATP-dependent helicase [Candidatus Saccharibacteria bacterium]
MKLNANQKQAVEYLAGPLLVIAGPGTGKTQLLSKKVEHILQNTDTNPENILCMTFTETGASNMRERLKTLIGQAAMKVNISTYHSFGSEILAKYANYAEDYDRRLEAAIDEVQRFKVVKKIQGSLPGNDILRKDNVKDIVEVISAAKGAGLSARDLAKIAEQNMDDSRVLSANIAPLLSKVVPRKFKESYENAYLPIYELLKSYTEAEMICKNVERSIGGLARDLKKAIAEAESSEKIKPLTSWKDAYFEKDGKGKYRLKDRVANKKLVSVAKVMEQYDRRLKKEGWYDFDDMIQEAVRVLNKDAGFRATMQERYQFVMLDEFQDTNPSQFAIIKALTDYEQPQVMAVGDDDQAIYEFQGAVSTNLTDFQAHYGAEVIALVDNYRSTQEILDFSREIINQAPDRFADKELMAHKTEPQDSQIYRYEFLSSDMEYDWVANKIDELVKGGVPQSEIAVISYKTKYFMPLLPYLKARSGINIAYEKKDDLFEIEPMRQIFTIARYVWELANEKRVDTAALEILSYPWWDLPILEVLKISTKAKHDRKSLFDYLGASEISEIKEVGEFLAGLVAKSFTEPLEIWLDYLIGAVELNGYRSPFLKYYTNKGEYSTFTLYENLAALRGKMKKHFGEKAVRLDDLIAMLNDYLEAEMALNVTSPYRDAEEAVQILSAHKAKGLEFQYVFVISTDHTAWGKGKGNNNLLSLPKNLTQIRHTGMTDGERLRVLYVALTRAKEGLFITNSVKDFNGKSPERLEYLNEYVEGDDVISEFLPRKKVVCEYEMCTSEIGEKNLQNWLKPYAKLDPDMRAIYAERVANWRMSASSLTEFIDVVNAGPQAFFRNHLLQAPREPENQILAMGNLVHATFEAVTNKGLSDEAAIEFFLKTLEEKDLPAEIKQALAEEGPENLAVALKEFGGLLRQGRAEVDLASEKLTIAGVPVTGKIDHIIVDDATKTIEIYDFKTGGYHKEKWQSHATLYKYMLQLEFYKLLLNTSPTYRRYKVEKAHILFVTPDKDGHVYDKVYEFNETEEQELIALMRAIYEQVSTLKFMDDPEIFVESDKGKKLKDIKEFIELLLAKS